MKKNSITSDFAQSVFAGIRAKEEYIDPQNHLPTPMIEITDEMLNPFKKDHVRIFAKDLRLPPLGHVKSGTVHQMYNAAKNNSKLKGVTRLHEATSGNTGTALALLSEKDVVVYVNDQTPEEKIRILQLFGAQVVRTNKGIQLARKKNKEKGNINLDQYDNSSNPDFFEKVIGPQIWNQTKGTINIFSAGLGTTGTMIGISNYLKKKNKNIRTIGIIVEEGSSVPGVRTKKRLEEVSLPWEKSVDGTQIVNEHDSYKKSLELIRETAILAGPSSGFSLQGLLQELKDLKRIGKLDAIKNESGEIIAVFPILDGPLLYIDDYFKNLDAKLFKKVKVESLKN
jgi:cysteine synthase